MDHFLSESMSLADSLTALWLIGAMGPLRALGPITKPKDSKREISIAPLALLRSLIYSGALKVCFQLPGCSLNACRTSLSDPDWVLGLYCIGCFV